MPPGKTPILTTIPKHASGMHQLKSTDEFGFPQDVKLRLILSRNKKRGQPPVERELAQTVPLRDLHHPLINVPLYDKHVFDTHIWWLRGAGAAKTSHDRADRCRYCHG